MISKRANETTSFIVMDVLERAQQLEKEGKEVIHLEVGEPDFKTPDPITESVIKAIREGKTGYTHSLGLLELREAICEEYHKKYKVNLSPDRVLVTSGTSPAMLIVFQTILEENDDFIISNPYYPCYPNFIKNAGGKVNLVKVTEEESFQYNVDDVKKSITPNTKGILINSPSNPTGSVMPAGKMKQIANLDLPYVVSDEIYHNLTYTDSPEHSILEFRDDALVLNGFSKAYSMTGWRLGYLIAPKKLMRPLQKLQQNYFISANNFVQWAGIIALTETESYLNEMRETYNKRRLYMISRLRELGFTIKHEPEGAFYVFVNAKKFTNNSRAFAFQILEETYVGVAPGIDFGSEGEGYLRFSYANSLENIEKGLDRLENFLKQIFNNRV